MEPGICLHGGWDAQFIIHPCKVLERTSQSPFLFFSSFQVSCLALPFRLVSFYWAVTHINWSSSLASLCFCIPFGNVGPCSPTSITKNNWRLLCSLHLLCLLQHAEWGEELQNVRHLPQSRLSSSSWSFGPRMFCFHSNSSIMVVVAVNYCLKS